MAHLRCPFLQTYYNPFSSGVSPSPANSYYHNEQKISPKKSPIRQSHSPRYRKIFKFNQRIFQTQNRLIQNYLALRINTLKNLPKSQGDFSLASDCAHILQLPLKKVSQNYYLQDASKRFRIDSQQIRTIISQTSGQIYSTRIASKEDNQQQFQQNSIIVSSPKFRSVIN